MDWILLPRRRRNTFVMKTAEAKSGKPASVYHFKGSLGHPIFTQDAIDDLYFFDFEDSTYTIRRVKESTDGTPYAEVVYTGKHGLTYFDYPPPSSQKALHKRFPAAIEIQRTWYFKVVASGYHKQLNAKADQQFSGCRSVPKMERLYKKV